MIQVVSENIFLKDLIQAVSENTFSQDLILAIVEGAIIGVFIIIVGYFLNRQLEIFKGEQESRMTQAQRRDETALKHLEAQIGEFYGPVWGLIRYNNSIHQVHKQRLELDKGDAEKGKIDQFFLQNYYLPYNRRIAELIQTKPHLIVENEIPPSFEQFLVHQAQIDSLTNLGTEDKISSEGIEPELWPSTFNEDVESALKKLKQEHNRFRRRLTEFA